MLTSGSHAALPVSTQAVHWASVAEALLRCAARSGPGRAGICDLGVGLSPQITGSVVGTCWDLASSTQDLSSLMRTGKDICQLVP